MGSFAYLVLWGPTPKETGCLLWLMKVDEREQIKTHHTVTEYGHFPEALSASCLYPPLYFRRPIRLFEKEGVAEAPARAF